MEIDTYIDSVRAQFELAAEAGGDEARALAGRIAPSLDAAIRLAVQDALAAAAEEITLELAPGSVELRLRGRDPEFVVSLPPADTGTGEVAEDQIVPASAWRPRGPRSQESAEGEDATMSRINLRLPDRLKTRVEEAAGAEGLSVNAWLVRTAASAVDRVDPIRRLDPRTPQGKQRYSGWAR
jgi:hypothetical protein